MSRSARASSNLARQHRVAPYSIPKAGLDEHLRAVGQERVSRSAAGRSARVHPLSNLTNTSDLGTAVLENLGEADHDESEPADSTFESELASRAATWEAFLVEFRGANWRRAHRKVVYWNPRGPGEEDYPEIRAPDLDLIISLFASYARDNPRDALKRTLEFLVLLLNNPKWRFSQSPAAVRMLNRPDVVPILLSLFAPGAADLFLAGHHGDSSYTRRLQQLPDADQHKAAGVYSTNHRRQPGEDLMVYHGQSQNVARRISEHTSIPYRIRNPSMHYHMTTLDKSVYPRQTSAYKLVVDTHTAPHATDVAELVWNVGLATVARYNPDAQHLCSLYDRARMPVNANLLHGLNVALGTECPTMNFLAVENGHRERDDSTSAEPQGRAADAADHWTSSQPRSSAEGGVDPREGGTRRSAREVCDWNDDAQQEESTSAEAHGEASGDEDDAHGSAEGEFERIEGGSGRSAPVHERNDANDDSEPDDTTSSTPFRRARVRHVVNANSAKPHGRAEGAGWIISALAGGNKHVRNSSLYASICVCGATIHPTSALRSLGWPEPAPGQSYTVSLQVLHPTVSSIADLRISATLDDHPTVQPFVLEHATDPLASSALNSGVAAAYATCWVWWKKYKSVMATKTHPTKAPATDRRNKLKLLATSGLEVPIGKNYTITRYFGRCLSTPEYMSARHGWTFKDIVDLDHHGEVHIRVVAAVNPPRSVDDLLLRLTPHNRARRPMDMVYGEQTELDRTLRQLHEHWLEIMSS